jgi:hypothetical protein
MENLQLAITAIKPPAAPDKEDSELKKSIWKKLREAHAALLSVENFITDNYPNAADVDKKFLDAVKNKMYDSIDLVVAAARGRENDYTLTWR